MLPEISMYAHNSLSACGKKNKEKKRGKCVLAAPVYIYGVYTSLAVNMFTRKPAALLRN